MSETLTTGIEAALRAWLNWLPDANVSDHPLLPRMRAAIAAYQAKGGEAPAIHATTDTAELKPVAWRVKDYADGWIIYTDEKRARIESVVMSGALVEPLYSADALSSLVRERDEALKHAETLLATAREDFVLMKETAGTVQSLTARATAAEADAARMREARAMPSDETARAFIAAWREKYPGAGFPTLGDAKEMLAATFGVVNYSENNDLQEVVLSCRTLDDLKATQQTILAMRALTT